MRPTADQSGDDSLSSRFQRLPLFDYLEKDVRATCVINVKQFPHSTRSALTMVYVNQAFRLVNPGSKVNTKNSINNSNSIPVESTEGAFEHLVGKIADDQTFHYSGLAWTAVTIHDEWRICSGVPTSTLPQKAGESTLKNETGSDNLSGCDSDLTFEIRSDSTSALSSSSQQEKQMQLNVLCSLVNYSNTESLQHCSLVEHSNWSKTSLGPRASWSSTTFQTVLNLLCNPEPCCTFWGNERTILYNEPYIALIRDFHPAAMSASAKTMFAEFWPQFEAICQTIEQTGSPVKQNEYRALVDRYNGVEELFFNGTFVPILDTYGRICGILNHVIEITNQVIAQRQMQALINIKGNVLYFQNLDEYWQSLSTSIRASTTDIPRMALYSVDSEFLLFHAKSSQSFGDPPADTWHLRSSYGFSSAPYPIPTVLNDSEIASVLRFSGKNEPVQLRSTAQQDYDLFRKLFAGYVNDEEDDTPLNFVVLSFSLSEGKSVACLVLGINPLRTYNAEYKSFVDLLGHQIESFATSIILQQKERQSVERTMAQAESQRRWLSDQLVQQKKEARQSELRFYNFAEQAPVGVYILGPTGHVKFANEAWYTLMDIQTGNEDPEPWLPSIHPDDRDFIENVWNALKAGQTQPNFEYRILSRSATGEKGEDVVYLRASCFPELAEDGTMQSVTGVLMDITANKAHENAIADRLVHTLEAKRAQENFMDMVSHEMRNPLSAMLQCAEEASQLLDGLSNLENIPSPGYDSINIACEVIDTIQWCGRHQRQIIDDVLTISKLDSELLALIPTQTTPLTVIDQAVKIFGSEIRAADIDLLLDTTSEDSHKQCWMDSNRVLQILINLVGNAIKFLKGRSIRKLNLRVTTSSSRPEGTTARMHFVPSGRLRRAFNRPNSNVEPVYIFFSVEDTGPGLTPTEMETLFARFQQASPRTHAQYGGTGLGLYISRELAEMHGGEIGLSSEAGQGSCFAFYIKAYQDPDTTATPLSKSTADPESQPEVTHIKLNSDGTLQRSSQLPIPETTILIVEDNLVNQRVLDRQLKKLGFMTRIANNGQEALTALKESQWWQDEIETPNGKKADKVNISIILCDLEMPIMDGLTCVRRIRQWQRDQSLKAHIPVVAVTGNARAEQVQAAREAGFDDVVCKPYSVPDLVPIVHKLVTAHHP